MIGLQLKEVSGAPPPEVKIRYDIVLQPIVVEGPLPRLPAADFTGREVQDEVYNYLDRIAQEVIRDSLAKGPVVGEEVLYRVNLTEDGVPNLRLRSTVSDTLISLEKPLEGSSRPRHPRIRSRS